jgi:hypothetical protein
VLRFTCPHCSVKLTAREERAGKRVLCPHCKGKITLPLPKQPEPATLPQNDIQLIDPPKPLDGTLLDLKNVRPNDDSGERNEEELLSSILPKSASEYTGERKFPWPLDILLYPLNGPGLMFLGLVLGVPLAMYAIGSLSLMVAMMLRVPFLIVRCLLGLYCVWYLAECVRTSAQGATRAAEAIADAPGLGDMLSRLLYLLGVWALFILPGVVYESYAHQHDVVFWLLTVWANVMFPMGLLAMVIFDSTCALNPLMLIGSIFRTFLPYMGLIAGFALLSFLVSRAFPGSETESSSIWLTIVTDMASFYGVLIVAHVLGRFYWRYRERLDWGV